MAVPLLTDLASDFIIARIWACFGFTETVVDLHGLNLGELKSCVFIAELASTQTLAGSWMQVSTYKGLKQH